MPRGLLDAVLGLVGSIGRYIESLVALAGEEAREAGTLYFRLLVLLVCALVFSAFGYLLLLVFAAVLLATVCQISWIWILLGFAVFHFLVALLCAVFARKYWRTPVFPATRREVFRDLEDLRGGRTP